MNILFKKIGLLSIVTCCLLISAVHAEEAELAGAYTVHYIAVNSSFISPEIAAQYGIVRSPRSAFLNISVIKNTGGTGTPVRATVTGEKGNLLGQNSTIDFIEIREGTAVYYLGQFEFSNAENLRFSLEIQPENSGPVYPISYTTQMYIN
tara:strand:- start:5509 stop:5958 length:450 start_codon:yes stop_codon:yes gene_type:complete